MKFFDKTLKNMNRFREILSVLIKYGFGELLDRSGLTRIARIKSSSFIKLKTEHLTVYQRISLAFQDLGPAFVKLGQIMAEREDVFPLALCKEFKKLQTSAKEISFDAALDVIKTELNADASDIFDKLYEKPVASASIAQVHRAMLKNGKMAAVKIQRPNIAAVISIDMDIIAYIAGILEHNDPSLTAIELKSMILRFAESIKKELDFENERKNIERFKSNFTKNKDIYIPKVYPQFSSSKILTMEFIEGTSLTEIFLNNSYLDKRASIAEKGVNIVLSQIFDHGYFHADPHPGNIFITDSGKICFLDFGMTGVLSTRDRYCLGDILLGLYNYDSKRAAKAIVTLTNYESDSTSLMERMLESLFDKYSHINLNDIKITEVFHEITKMMSSLSIKVPNQMHILIKTLITIEGVGRRLYPDFNIFDHISPFAKNLIKSRLSPKKLIKDIYLATLDMTMLVKDLPFELHEILYKAKNGRLKMIYEIKNMESLLMTVEKITNRISFSIVLAALIIGSSLIVLAKVPPLWNNIPLIGIAGYIAAGLMGFGLLIDIIRNKKM